MITSELFSVKGCVAVVTGGLGQLGSVYAKCLIANGARVAVVDQRLPEADPIPGAHYSAADITSRAELETALEGIRSALGAPAILINNAALDSPPGSPAEENGPFESYPEESWDRVLDVNLKGTFLCCQVFGGAMAEAGRGSVINVGSIYGVVSPDQKIYAYRSANGGAPFFKPVAYSASKSGILNLTRYLAGYWAARGVRVNTLTLAGVFNHQDEQFLANYLPKVPLGRMADPADYIGPVLFLASEASRYMTGANLVIDGGYTVW